MDIVLLMEQLDGGVYFERGGKTCRTPQDVLAVIDDIVAARSAEALRFKEQAIAAEVRCADALVAEIARTFPFALREALEKTKDAPATTAERSATETPADAGEWRLWAGKLLDLADEARKRAVETAPNDDERFAEYCDQAVRLVQFVFCTGPESYAFRDEAVPTFSGRKDGEGDQ